MNQDKYHPIPGEMDSIDCLRKERDELKDKVEELQRDVKEWICEQCNYIYPGPPGPGFSGVLCKWCGCMTGPRTIMENIKLKEKLKIAVEALEKMRSPYAMDRQGVANEALGKIGDGK